MRKIFKTIPLTFLLLLYFCGFSFASEALLDAELGYNNNCKLDSLENLNIEIKATDKSLKGELRVKSSDSEYKHDLKVSKKNTVRHSFKIPITNGQEKIEISIVEKDKLLAKKEIIPNIYPSNTSFIGSLNGSNKNFDFLKEMEVYPLDINFEVFNLKNLEVLENLDFILMDDLAYKGLSDLEKEKITAWISEGKTLLREAEKNTEKSMGIGKLVAIEASVFNNSNDELKKIVLENLNTKNLNELQNKSLAIENIPESDSLLKTDMKTAYLLLALIFLYFLSLFICFLLREKYSWSFYLAVIISCLFFFFLSITGGATKGRGALIGERVYSDLIYEDKNLIFYPSKNKAEKISFQKDEDFLVLNKNQEIDPIKKEVTFLDDEHYSLLINKKDAKNLKIAELDFDSRKNILLGEIKNPLAENLEKSFLVLGDTMIPLGNIKGRSSLNLEYRLDENMQALTDFNYLEKVNSLNHLSDLEKEMYRNFFFKREKSLKRAYLVGFTDSKEKIRVNNKNWKLKNKDLNVFILEDVSFNRISGVYRGVFKNSYIADVSNNEYVLNDDEYLTIAYPLSKDVKKVSFVFAEENKNLSWEIYNPELNVWEKLSLEEADLSKKVSQGKLFLRISGNERIIIPSIIVENNLESEAL